MDFESTGLSVTEDRGIQFGFSLYDTKYKRTLESHEFLIHRHDFPVSSIEAEDTHGLTLEFLKEHGRSPVAVFKEAIRVMNLSDHLLAWNGSNFDFPMWKNECLRYRLEAPPIPCIDPRIDIKFPKKISCHKLQHVALELGIKPRKAHSALEDVFTMFDVVSHFDIDEMVERSKSVMVKVIADIPREENAKVKRLRFMWDPEKRRWWKNIRQFDVESLMAEVNFKVRFEA